MEFAPKYGNAISRRRFIQVSVHQDKHEMIVSVLVPQEQLEFRQLFQYASEKMRESPTPDYQFFYVVELKGFHYVVSPIFSKEDGRFLGFYTPGHTDRQTTFGIIDNDGVLEFGNGCHKIDDAELIDFRFVGFVETDIMEVVFPISPAVFMQYIRIPENFCKFFLATNIGFVPHRIDAFFENDQFDLRNPVLGKKTIVQAFYQEFFYNRFPAIRRAFQLSLAAPIAAPIAAPVAAPIAAPVAAPIAAPVEASASSSSSSSSASSSSSSSSAPPAPTLAPAPPAPTLAPASPVPTLAPASPVPTFAPASPVPTFAPASPVPTFAPAPPAPTLAPAPTAGSASSAYSALRGVDDINFSEIGELFNLFLESAAMAPSLVKMITANGEEASLAQKRKISEIESEVVEIEEEIEMIEERVAVINSNHANADPVKIRISGSSYISDFEALRAELQEKQLKKANADRLPHLHQKVEELNAKKRRVSETVVTVDGKLVADFKDVISKFAEIKSTVVVHRV